MLFAIAFFGVPFYHMTTGKTMNINGEITHVTLSNSFPFFIIGGLAIILFIWICTNYFRVELSSNQVTKILIGKNQVYNWEDMEVIDEVTWLWKGTIFKFRPINGKAFYIHADKAELGFKNPFKGGLDEMTYFKTKMGKLIMQKKSELKK